MKNKKGDDRRTWARQAGLLSTVPFLLVVPPIAGVLIGDYLDNRFETSPVFTIILLTLGFVAGAREVAIVIKKANAADNNNDDK